MPLGNFGQIPSSDVSTKDLADLVARLIKEVNYLLNGGLDTLNVNELSADVINAGTLNAALVTVKAALAGSAYILLNATQGLIINDGTKNTFQADINGLVTMVGALIKSTNNYPRVELNSQGNLISAFSDATHYVSFNPSTSSGPGMNWIDGGVTSGYLAYAAATGIIMATFGSNQQITFQPSGDFNINPSGRVNINGASGYTGSISYVKNVVSGSPVFGTITVTKGIITNVA